MNPLRVLFIFFEWWPWGTISVLSMIVWFVSAVLQHWFPIFSYPFAISTIVWFFSTWKVASIFFREFKKFSGEEEIE